MRLAFAAMAALSTKANGGLMPQARQGGNGKASVAIVGSKLDGTGLENEQMGHTQVPTTTGKDGVGRAEGRNGLVDRDAGEDADATLWNCGDCDTPGLAILPKPRFNGFGNKVIFGEDFRNLA
jgi:hypothetical protein